MTLVRKENLKFVGKILLIILVIPISVIIGICWIQTFPMSSGVKILSINIIYQDHQDNYGGELVDCADKTVEGAAIALLFYNLNYNKTYYIFDGRDQSHKITEFSEREAFRLWITANKGDSLFLASDNGDLIWICIEKD